MEFRFICFLFIWNSNQTKNRCLQTHFSSNVIDWVFWRWKKKIRYKCYYVEHENEWSKTENSILKQEIKNGSCFSYIYIFRLKLKMLKIPKNNFIVTFFIQYYCWNVKTPNERNSHLFVQQTVYGCYQENRHFHKGYTTSPLCFLLFYFFTFFVQ